MSARRLERLVSLMNVLQDTTRALSAAELRDRVAGYPDNNDSFHRQFERDKDELREMGIPLVVEAVPASDPPILGYRIDRRELFQTPSDLTEDEVEALNMAASVVGFSGGLSRQALFKVGGVAAAGSQRVEMVYDADLIAMFTAVVDRCVLRFVYHGEAREVDPARLQFARGRWYLGGFDRGRRGFRWFRVSRVEGGLEVGAPNSAQTIADHGATLTLDPWALPGDPPVTARIWFDPVAASTVRDQVPDATVLADDGDGLVVEMEVLNWEGFRSWVLTFLERAEVLGPPDLRQMMVDWLESIAASGAAPGGEATS
ncbi:MAG: WYL domain-containing protein [Microthrixaceae bacterium]|nr:WYL domain-containing protein [Acidimicrobiales bacterium]MCB9404817.1 WYL domain-containing protein [Microthrixaceae bacterium]